MIEIERSTPVRGDETAGYRVSKTREFTLREFLQYLCKEKKNEWGKVGIKHPHHLLGSPYCEYSWGRLGKKKFTDDLLDRQVDTLIGHGGWSMMNYIITLKK